MNSVFVQGFVSLCIQTNISTQQHLSVKPNKSLSWHNELVSAIMRAFVIGYSTLQILLHADISKIGL